MTNDAEYQIIYDWHTRAQLDYREAYTRLFICYNSWFRQVTGARTDRLAINKLKHRFVIWADYENNRTLQSLRPVLSEIARTTSNPSNIGVIVADENDWKSLIEYWYQVRCHLFHGSAITDQPMYHRQIELAYHSLNIFMTEIIARMKQSFTADDAKELHQTTQLIELGAPNASELQAILGRLQTKYINSPDIWNVDMMKI